MKIFGQKWNAAGKIQKMEWLDTGFAAFSVSCTFSAPRNVIYLMKAEMLCTQQAEN